MRLIDADALLDGVKIQMLDEDYDITCVISDIENAPTIEAEPVRHGRWDTFFSDSYKVHEIGVECSCCGYRTQERTTYCPHCGAKMDGGDKNAIS